MSEIVKIDKEVQMLADLKQASMAIAKKCNDVVITNDTEYAIAIQIFSDANKTASAIEKKRKELKEPYLDAGKRIDAAAKAISEDLELAVAEGKKKALAWSQEQQRKQQEELQRIQKIKNAIINYKNDVMAKIDRCATEQELVDVYNEKIKVFPDNSNWGEFGEDAKLMRVAISNYAKAKKVELTKPFEGEEARQVMQEIEEKTVEAEEVIGAEQIAEINITKPSGVRTNWKFEVVDFSKIPDEYKVLDEVKVRAWQKQMREAGGLVEGAVHFGIKHFTEQSMTLK